MHEVFYDLRIRMHVALSPSSADSVNEAKARMNKLYVRRIKLPLTMYTGTYTHHIKKTQGKLGQHDINHRG